MEGRKGEGLQVEGGGGVKGVDDKLSYRSVSRGRPRTSGVPYIIGVTGFEKEGGGEEEGNGGGGGGGVWPYNSG